MESVEIIEDYAFQNNRLEAINLPNVKTIKSFVFSGNQLQSVSLNNIEYIGYAAFIGSNDISSNRITSLYDQT